MQIRITIKNEHLNFCVLIYVDFTFSRKLTGKLLCAKYMQVRIYPNMNSSNVCVLINAGSHFVEKEQLHFCVLINTDLHLAESEYIQVLI